MIAYVRLTLLRWSRQTSARGAVLVSALAPVSYAATMIILYWLPWNEDRDNFWFHWFTSTSITVAVLAVAGSLVHLLTSTINDEVEGGRVPLLRSSRLDAPTAGLAFLILVAIATAVLVPLSLIGPRLAVLVIGADWISARDVAVVVAAAATTGVVAVGVRLVFPHTTAMALSVAAVLGASVLASIQLEQQQTATGTDVMAVSVAALAVATLVVLGLTLRGARSWR